MRQMEFDTLELGRRVARKLLFPTIRYLVLNRTTRSHLT